MPPNALLAYGGSWTGWARFARGAHELLEWTPATVAGTIPDRAVTHSVSGFISIETGQEFLRAQREALDGTFPDLMIGGREADAKVWISRNVAFHPSVSITPPVYIGENCRIGQGVRLGPSAVIGSNCIVDEQSLVVNSMVAPGTYIGEALELDSVIVDRNPLVNIRLGTSFLVSETFLLGSLTERSGRRVLQRLRDRLIAFVVLLLFWPVLLLTVAFLKLTGQGGFRWTRLWTSRRTTTPPPGRNHRCSAWRRVSSDAATSCIDSSQVCCQWSWARSSSSLQPRADRRSPLCLPTGGLST